MRIPEYDPERGFPPSQEAALEYLDGCYDSLLDKAGFEPLNKAIHDKLVQLVEDFYHT